MRDRLSYAVIGLVFGVVLAALLWWLYGIGLSGRLGTPAMQPDFLAWAKYVGGGCAVAGFILKDRIGDLVGGAFSAVYDAEGGSDKEHHASTWEVVIVIACVAAAVWYFLAK
jgi:glutamate-1-semialdehyde aminotransferase